MDTAGQNDAVSAPSFPAPETEETGRFTSRLLAIYAAAYAPTAILAVAMLIVQAGMEPFEVVDAPPLPVWLWFLAALTPIAAAVGVLFLARQHSSPSVARTALVLAGVNLLGLIPALLFGWAPMILVITLVVWAVTLRNRWIVIGAAGVLATLVLPTVLWLIEANSFWYAPSYVTPALKVAALVTLIACAVKARTSRA